MLKTLGTLCPINFRHAASEDRERSCCVFNQLWYIVRVAEAGVEPVDAMENVARQYGSLTGSPDRLVPRLLQHEIADPAKHAVLSHASTVARRCL